LLLLGRKRSMHPWPGTSAGSKMSHAFPDACEPPPAPEGETDWVGRIVLEIVTRISTGSSPLALPAQGQQPAISRGGSAPCNCPRLDMRIWEMRQPPGSPRFRTEE